MKEENFIGIFENSFSKEFCEKYINVFETYKKSGLTFRRNKTEITDESISIPGSVLDNLESINLPLYFMKEFSDIFFPLYDQYASKFSILNRVSKHAIYDFKLQKRLGYVTNAPRWAIAHKFSANSSVSKILDIEIQVGRTGALTPVAKIKPVNIGGVIVSNATLHNEDEIVRKDIRVGDTVTVERAGDVIPHVVSVDKKKRPKNSKKFIFPKNCPSCGSKVIKQFNYIKICLKLIIYSF